MTNATNSLPMPDLDTLFQARLLIDAKQSDEDEIVEAAAKLLLETDPITALHIWSAASHNGSFLKKFHLLVGGRVISIVYGNVDYDFEIIKHCLNQDNAPELHKQLEVTLNAKYEEYKRNLSVSTDSNINQNSIEK